MQSLWNDTDAAQYTDPLDLRVYTSRLLGKNPELVLHGGGNTSVTDYFAAKTRQPLGVKFLPIVTRSTADLRLSGTSSRGTPP